jgi:hypothetical protein
MDDHEPQDDPLVALRAGLDQAIAMAPEIARTARGFFNAFAAEGFTESQALYLAACQMHGKPGNAP